MSVILKPCGDHVVTLAINARCPTHVAFVTADVLIDFSVIAGVPCTLRITNVYKLRQATMKNLNAGVTGNQTAVTPNYGPADFLAITPKEFKTMVFVSTRQTRAALVDFKRVNVSGGYDTNQEPTPSTYEGTVQIVDSFFRHLLF